MSDFKKTEGTGDWELSEDFYNGGTDRDLKLEDFLEEGEMESDGDFLSDSDERLQQTVREIEAVLALSAKSHPISEIAASLELEPSYVEIILQCSQGAREDDIIAIAHLVLMSL